jgi:hypothetical protein
VTRLALGVALELVGDGEVRVLAREREPTNQSNGLAYSV